MSQIGASGSSGTDLTGRDIVAWCTFDGTGAGPTLSIIDGYNVTNVTDNTTGDYTINFTSTLSNANYAVIVNANRSDQLEPLIASVKTVAGKTTSAVTIFLQDNAGVAADGKDVTVVCIGD